MQTNKKIIENYITPLTAEILFAKVAMDSFFMSTPKYTLLTEGIAQVLQEPLASDRLFNQLQDYNGFIVGAFPFDREAPSHLIIPQQIYNGSPLNFNSTESCSCASEMISIDKENICFESIPTTNNYLNAVKKALVLMDCHEIDKIVLARSLKVDWSLQNISAVLYKLANKNSSAFTFATPLPGNRTLLGASPELLVAKKGEKIISHPLAGSRPRSADPIEDKKRAEELIASKKDLHEHAIVVHSVARALQPFCRNLIVPERPTLTSTSTMWHLGTKIHGELLDSTISSLVLVKALHPTPAVCGYPTYKARELIADLENYDRGFYAGTLGWCNSAGDGEWVVSIRCAELQEQSLRLFAGAGIVPGSIPELELAETTAKFNTMLAGLGIQ